MLNSRYRDFMPIQNGRGIRYLSCAAPKLVTIDTQCLFYTFQCLASDGIFSIYAIFLLELEILNNRQRILTLLNHGIPDRVPWAGDMDYWYSAAQSRGELPAAYAGDGYFQLNRDLGMGFYLQGFYPFEMRHPGITFSDQIDGDRRIRTMHTPLGDLSEIQQYLPTSFSWGYVKHYLETPADLPAFRSYIERLEFSPAYAEAERRKAIIGDNGVVLVYAPRSPFMEMVTNYAGIVPLVYLLNDAPDEMAELLALMEGKHDIAAEMAANSPADCVMIPENLSSEVVGARYYKLFLHPYERKWIERIRQNGKYSFIHLDGTLKGLIGLVSETGFDVIEAVTPLPCGDISMAQAMESVRPETILWGGLPGVIFTPLFPEPDFEQHVIAMLNLMKRRPNYVLGVGDQVPPDGLLERVARVASLCATHGQYAGATALG